jgi:hypothetical protein
MILHLGFGLVFCDPEWLFKTLYEDTPFPALIRDIETDVVLYINPATLKDDGHCFDEDQRDIMLIFSLFS